ncbi:hypothetical protein AX17_006134 [Amanita inopinata Kibby_2008]|nr:hypothetical protein AX17_006134 [Amanita inopinata Kibby_2008]
MDDKLEAKSTSTNVSPRWKHEIYYLEDIYFMFDNTMFKVPRIYLLKSPVFRALLGGKVVDDKTLQSDLTGDGTIHKPLTCNSVRKESLVLILRILYPTDFDEAPQFTVDEWRDVLELSLKWRLDKIHDLAIRRLSNMQLDAVTKLELARRHDIQKQEWLLPAIQTLVKEDKQLTEEEVVIIGIKMAMKIARAQGMFQGKCVPSSGTTDSKRPPSPIGVPSGWGSILTATAAPGQNVTPTSKPRTVPIKALQSSNEVPALFASTIHKPCTASVGKAPQMPRKATEDEQAIPSNNSKDIWPSFESSQDRCIRKAFPELF